MSSTRMKPLLWLAKSPQTSKGSLEPASAPSESSLKVKSVLALPKDVSLLNAKGRTAEDKTRRRLGLPSHVPHDWPGFGDHHPELLLDPDDHVTPEGTPEKYPLIRAGSPKRPATSECRAPDSCDDMDTQGDDATRDTMYSYVFPDTRSLCPVSTPRMTPAPDSAAAVQPALHEPAFKPLSYDEVTGAKKLPCDYVHAGSPAPAALCYEAAQDRNMRSSAGAAAHGASMDGSEVFPDLLPQQVLQFAEMPLKPLPACIGSDHPASPLGPLDHPWLSSGELESADRSSIPSGCSTNEDQRIELLPGPGPDLARQESAPAGALASHQDRSLVVGLSLPAGYEVTKQVPAAAAPVPASRGSSAGAAETLLQAGEAPTPVQHEAAQAAWSSDQSCASGPGQVAVRRKPRPALKRTGDVSSALIAEEAESKMVQTQLRYLLARAAGLLLVVLLTPMYISAHRAVRSSYLES